MKRGEWVNKQPINQSISQWIWNIQKSLRIKLKSFFFFFFYKNHENQVGEMQTGLADGLAICSNWKKMKGPFQITVNSMVFDAVLLYRGENKTSKKFVFAE